MSTVAGVEGSTVSLPPTACVRITRRPNVVIHALRRYRVWVNGRVVGTIRPGRTKSFPVTDGPNQLQLSVGSQKSQTVNFDLGPEEVAEFVCAPVGEVAGVLNTRELLDTRPRISLTAL